MEIANDHRRRLTELLHITQAQNTQLRQFVSCPPATDDVPASTVDVSAPMSSIGELCYISVVLTVSSLAYFCTCMPFPKYFLVGGCCSPKGCQDKGEQCYSSVPPSRLAKKCKVYGKLILRKVVEIVVTRCHILELKCTKFDFCWSSVPDPASGAYSTL